MLIFYLNIFTVIFYGFLYSLSPTRTTKKILIVLITLQLILIVGLRSYKINTDTLNYFYTFKRLDKETFSQFFAPTNIASDNYAYKFLNYIVWAIGLDFQCLLIITACLEIIPFSIFIYKHSKNFIFSFLLLLFFNFYLYSLITIRQTIAYGFMLLNIENIIKRRPFRFIFFILLISMVHISTIVFLPAYLLLKVKPTKKTLVCYMTASVLIFALRHVLVNFLIGAIFTDYKIVESPSYMFLLFNLLIFLVSLYLVKKYKANFLSKTEEELNNFFLIIFLTGVLLMIFGTVADNALRIVQFYSVIVIVLVPNSISLVKPKDTKKLLTVIAIIFFFAAYIKISSSIFSENMPEYIPYWVK